MQIVLSDETLFLMIKPFIAVYLIVIIFALFGCSAKEINNFDRKIWMNSPTYVELPYYGGGHEIKFKAQLDWTIKSDASWVIFAGPAQGNGHATIVLNLGENTSAEPRNARLTLVLKGGDTQIIEIRQRGKFSYEATNKPSLLYTEEELLALKDIIDHGRSESVTATYQHLIARCNTALSFVTKPYIGSNPLDFYHALVPTASYSRDLAMAYWFTGQEAYAEKSIQLMKDWAVQTKNNHYESLLHQGIGTGTGMYLGRAMLPMLMAYDMLVGKYEIDVETKANIVDWFRTLYPANMESIQIWEENDYFGKQYYQNHTVAHSLSIMALGFILEDQDMIRFGIDSKANPRDLYDLIAGSIFMAGDTPRAGDNAKPTETGEVYDRYRHDASRGLQYAHLTQSLLATMARILHNNGLDIFSYTAPSGENLRLTYDYYADFYRLKDACIKSGYYCGETARIGLAGDEPAAYEMGLRHYPDSDAIKSLLESGVFDRAQGYYDHFGYTRFLSATVDQ